MHSIRVSSIAHKTMPIILGDNWRKRASCRLSCGLRHGLRGRPHCTICQAPTNAWEGAAYIWTSVSCWLRQL